MPQSPLLNLAAPAATVELAGWTIAQHYGDPTAEVAAVHDACGLVDLSPRGRIQVRGDQPQVWIDRLISNDAASLAVARGVRALLLTVKGRIACDLWVHRLGADRLLVETAFDTYDWLLGFLRKHILFGDRIEVTGLRDEVAQLGLHGPRAGAALEDATGLPAATLEPLDSAAQDELTVVRVAHLGVDGFDLFVPVETAAELWTRLAVEAQPFGWTASEILRLEAGLPRWGAELTPEHFPLEAELEEALSHTKGCYPGQEFVARMRDRGHANRLLRALDVEGRVAPGRGAELLAEGQDKPVGAVTSAALSPTLGVRALAYLRAAHSEPGTSLQIQLAEDTSVAATVRPAATTTRSA